MIVKKQNKGIEIDLTGPQGNAFFLLGTASKLGRQLGWEYQDAKDAYETAAQQLNPGWASDLTRSITEEYLKAAEGKVFIYHEHEIAPPEPEPIKTFNLYGEYE